MKKTYISPSFVMVKLNPINAVMIIGSTLGMDNSNENSLDNSSDILTNEYNPISDKSLWDSEW